MACTPVTKTLRNDFSEVVYISCTVDGSELTFSGKCVCASNSSHRIRSWSFPSAFWDLCR